MKFEILKTEDICTLHYNGLRTDLSRSHSKTRDTLTGCSHIVVIPLTQAILKGEGVRRVSLLLSLLLAFYFLTQ